MLAGNLVGFLLRCSVSFFRPSRMFRWDPQALENQAGLRLFDLRVPRWTEGPLAVDRGPRSNLVRPSFGVPRLLHEAIGMRTQ